MIKMQFLLRRLKAGHMKIHPAVDISLLNRNREKPLSKLLFRAMKMNRKKFDR